MTDMECPICCEDFTKSVRAPVTCPACDMAICRACIRTYLTGTTSLAHCMSCKNKWELDFLTQATLKAFVNGEYHQHRKNLLVDHERSRLPETMPAVEAHVKTEELKEVASQLRAEREALQEKLRNVKQREWSVSDSIYRLRPDFNGPQETNEKRTFVQRCGADDCRGFLSTAWKCGACKHYTCSKCMELKGIAKDSEHVCDPASVESATLIRKESRNCPTCAVPIFKISGCDQMWCTQCHVAFSWRTGNRLNGIVHNPHFYAWQKEGGAAPLQPPGAVVCGGLPAFYAFQRDLRRHLGDRNRSISASNLHRAASHFRHWEVQGLRRACNRQTDNLDLRVSFVLKRITEAELGTKLIRRDKMRNKKLALLQIYELVNTVLVEGINDISAACRCEVNPGVSTPSVIAAIEKNLARCHKVREYANAELSKLSILYSQTVSIIKPSFYTESKKFKRLPTTAGDAGD